MQSRSEGNVSLPETVRKPDHQRHPQGVPAQGKGFPERESRGVGSVRVALQQQAAKVPRVAHSDGASSGADSTPVAFALTIQTLIEAYNHIPPWKLMVSITELCDRSLSEMAERKPWDRQVKEKIQKSGKGCDRHTPSAVSMNSLPATPRPRFSQEEPPRIRKRMRRQWKNFPTENVLSSRGPPLRTCRDCSCRTPPPRARR